MALPQIPKQKLFLIIGLILGIVALVMIKTYIDQEKSVERERVSRAISKMQTDQTAVLMARQDIPQGEVIEPNMFEPAIVPNQYLQSQAVTSVDKIAGMTTTAPIAKGEQITLSKLNSAAGTSASSTRRLGGGALAGSTPTGKRAITISVDNIAALGGMIAPGDYVDVLATIPLPAQTADGQQFNQSAVVPLFQNVLVLAIGQEIVAPTAPEGRYKKEEKKGFSPLITLALTPQEANLTAFVQEQSKIKLLLRSPADTAIEPVRAGNWDALFQYLMPKKEESTESTVEEPKPEIKYVEVYRGLNKEKVPLPQ